MNVSAALLDLPAWADRPLGSKVLAAAVILMGAVFASRVINRSIARIYRRRADRLASEHPDVVGRAKREQTVLTLLQSVTRYVIYGAALLLLISVFVGGDATSAVFGLSSVVIVGFGLQRMFGDVVAGMLLLFEQQYGVGDFVTVEVPKAAGVVGSFGLRTTTLRTLTGERTVVLNGAITGFTKAASGFRDCRLQFAVRDEEAARRAFTTACGRLPLGEPHVLVTPTIEVVDPSHQDAADTATVMRVRVVVLPPLCELVFVHLREALTAELGETLIGPIVPYDWDPASMQLASRAVLVPST